MAPNSPELLALPKASLEDSQKNTEYGNDHGERKSEIIVQRYICNEMTWNRRKFDVRMYWFVASLNPLIVLYHDGYVRVGNSDYSESDFTDTKGEW
jgi:hypothetical protein